MKCDPVLFSFQSPCYEMHVVTHLCDSLKCYVSKLSNLEMIYKLGFVIQYSLVKQSVWL